MVRSDARDIIIELEENPELISLEWNPLEIELIENDTIMFEWLDDSSYREG